MHALLAVLALLVCQMAAFSTPLIVAHRGASKDAPENTVPAFQLAWQQGADAIELDLRLTKDGHLVCIHDADTKRVAGKKLVVAESSLAALRALDAGANHGPAFADTRIPTLEEAFATVPADKTVYVEIKTGPAIVTPLLAAVRRAKIQPRQVVVIAFDAEVIRALKHAGAEHKAFWLLSRKTTLTGKLEPTTASILNTLADIRADGLSTKHETSDETLIKDIIRAGYEHHVWTVDAPADALRFARWGAKSITTNTPAIIRGGLAR